MTVVLLAGCGGGAGGEERGAATGGLAGMVRDPAPRVDAEPLPDASRADAAMPLRAADDGLLLVYFGYTSCPDVCPTTMADLRIALGDLTQAERERVQVAMVTIDPTRDLGEVLTNYVQTFVPDGHALRTEDAVLLERVADRFGASYSVERGESGAIEVSHTAFLYVVDDAGLLRLQWPFGTTADAVSRDLDSLLQGLDRGGSAAAPDPTDQEVS
ncbi:MAG: SCO family protein [Thermoleophilia bacterium]